MPRPRTTMNFKRPVEEMSSSELEMHIRMYERKKTAAASKSQQAINDADAISAKKYAEAAANLQAHLQHARSVLIKKKCEERYG